MLRPGLLAMSLVMLGAALAPAPGLAAPYALQPVKGPKGSAPREVERAILDRLETRGDEGHLGEPRPGERLIAVKIKKRGRVFNAELSVSEPGGGASVGRRVGTYHPRRGVSSSIAVLLDRLLDGLNSAGAVSASEQDTELPSGEEMEADESEEGETAGPSEGPAAEDDVEDPGDGELEAAEETSPAAASERLETEVEGVAQARSRLGLDIGLALGTQLLSRYTVSVESGPTALAYRASPLFLIAPSLRFQAPATPIWVALRAELAQVGFTLATEPPLDPGVARGAFLAMELEVGWALVLAEGLSLAPMAAIRLERLGVDEQSALVPGPGGDPVPTAFDVVLSSLAVVPEIGVLGRYAITSDFEVNLEARLRLIASYSESPTTSGAAGPGIGMALGGGFGWRFLDWLALELELRYQYSAVSFSGDATRVPFANDPPLVDASIAYEDLKLSMGPVLRL